MYIKCYTIVSMVGRILFTYRKKSTKKDKEKQNKTKENYVQQTTIYNNHIGTQQINYSLFIDVLGSMKYISNNNNKYIGLQIG